MSFSHFYRLNGIKKRFASTVAKILADGPQSNPITIKGWIRHHRQHKQHCFSVLSDGLSTETVQIVAERSMVPKNLKAGCAVAVTGRLIPSLGRGQKFDFIPDSLEVLSNFDAEDCPYTTKNTYDINYLRQNLHLRPKTRVFGAFFRLRSAATLIVHNYFQEKRFILVDTPVLTGNDCEGAGEVFVVEPENKAFVSAAQVEIMDENGDLVPTVREFFGKPVYNAVSGQLHLEAAACSLNRVYTLNPAFRAEVSVSRHHLAELRMLEVEMAFVNKLDVLLDLVEDLFRDCANRILDTCASDYSVCSEFHSEEHTKVVAKTLASADRFPRLTYEEAAVIVQKRTGKVSSKHMKGGFSKEDEREIVRHCGNSPVFVTNFSAASKPFYMKRYPGTETAMCFDFLVPLAGELAGGSIRENDYETLEARLNEHGLTEKLDWYLELRKFGYPTTGGFGLGFERYLQWLIGAFNVKDCIPFPRWYGRCQL